MTEHYRKLRSLGVRANAAGYAARLIAEFKSPPTESDYLWVAAHLRQTARVPLSYLPRAERNRLTRQVHPVDC